MDQGVFFRSLGSDFVDEFEGGSNEFNLQANGKNPSPQARQIAPIPVPLQILRHLRRLVVSLLDITINWVPVFLAWFPAGGSPRFDISSVQFVDLDAVRVSSVGSRPTKEGADLF